MAGPREPVTFVLGRDGDDDEKDGHESNDRASDGSDDDGGPATGRFGTYRALDGSEGAPLALDLEGPHAALIVGKRGYGKSYTLGVLAEELARAPGVAPVVVDPMGAFTALEEPARGESVPATVLESPTVTPDALDPRSWCAMLGLDAESGVGTLVWRATAAESTVPAMRDHAASADAPDADVRGAINHLELAETWGVFDPDGSTAEALLEGDVTVLDVSGLDDAPMNAVARGVAEALYRARVDEAVPRLPWLLVDEAHAFFRGVAGDALETILTRGRAPGVSLVAATQRPSAVPDVAISQSDVVVSHRLTSRPDLEALERARPTYVEASYADRMPTAPGEVVVVDDATESVHAATIRERATPHGGGSPRASELAREE